MARTKIVGVIGFVLTVSGWTTQAVAVDGIKLLSQPKTFPIVISTPGSYRLKKNITVPDENTTAIQITVSNVTLDLNGFSIIGPTVCSGNPTVTSCTPVGSGTGIQATANNVTILNGMITGMGNIGIAMGQGRIEGVTVSNNGLDGLNGAIYSSISRVVATNNGRIGIGTGAFCNISNSVSSGNKDRGIGAADGSSVSGNVVVNNGGDGIWTNSDSSVIGNTVRFSGGYGIFMFDGGYANNVSTGNTLGAVSGGINMGHNVCNLSLCP